MDEGLNPGIQGLIYSELKTLPDTGGDLSDHLNLGTVNTTTDPEQTTGGQHQKIESPGIK